MMRNAERPAIIMYHRVAQVDYDPWGLAVAPDHFAAQLDLLARSRTVMPMAEFVACHMAGTLPRNAAAITFDDGYYDNLAAAAPLLVQADMTATLFVSTGPSLTGTSYWFEDLADLILDDDQPADCPIALADNCYSIRYGHRESADDDRQNWRAWDMLRTDRERVFHTLWDAIRVLVPAEQQDALARIGAALNRVPSRKARPMTAGELKAIAVGPFALGGHTIDHVDLLTLDDDEALNQIAGGKAQIDDLANMSSAGFAYPYGRHDARIARLVRKAGFEWACTTEHAHLDARRTIDSYLLPRIQAEDEPTIDWLN